MSVNDPFTDMTSRRVALNRNAPPTDVTQRPDVIHLPDV